MGTVDKERLRQQLLSKIESEIKILTAATAAAAEAATHAEAKPENKYDTRGLEASYLAGAQRERLAELEACHRALTAFPMKGFSPDDKVASGAIVRLRGVDSDDGDANEDYFWLLPVGAGYALELEDQGRETRRLVTVTPSSPMGRSLQTKGLGDLVAVESRRGAEPKEFEIIGLL